MISPNEFLGMLIIGLGALTAIIAPIIKLNSSITKLDTTLDNMAQNDRTRDKRINAHAVQLDEHEKQLVNHEVRLQHMEKGER